MTYLYCYDITDPVRLRRIAKELERFGLRVQRSVFQVDAGPPRHKKLISTIRRFMDRRVDSLRVYPLCEDCLAKTVVEGDRAILQPVQYIIL